MCLVQGGGLLLSGDGTRAENVDISAANNTIIFDTDSSERMRIDGSGNLLLNTTSSTGHKMTVVADASAGAIDAVGSPTNGYYAFRVDMPSTNTYGVLLRNNGNNVGDVRVNSSSTSYNTSSDHRLKENVTADCCLLYTSPSPRDGLLSRMPSSA